MAEARDFAGGVTPEWPLERQAVDGDRDGASAWIEYVLYRGAVGLFSHLPSSGRRALSSVIGRLAKAIDRKRSRAASEFIAQALPRLDARERDALVLAAWRHLIELTLEDARFNSTVLGPRLMEHFDVEVCEDAQKLIRDGGGALCVVPHVGMWEAMPAIGAAIGLRPAYVVSRPPRNRPLSRFAQATREARGYRLMHRHGAIEGLTKVVQGGGYVGLMLDQRARGKTSLAPFFGRMAHCERSIPVLARRLRKPLLFAACYRTDRPFRYRAVVSKVLWPTELARMSPDEIVVEINREMERMILAAPEQYFWLHDRYRNAPPAQAGVPAAASESPPQGI